MTSENTTTYEQAAVEDVLFTLDNGKTRLEREMESAFFKSVGRWLVGGGVVVIISVSGLWFKVQANTEKIENALTEDQAALIIQRVDQLNLSVQEKNETLKDIDARLRAKGI